MHMVEYNFQEHDIVFVEQYYNGWVFAFDINDSKYFENGVQLSPVFFAEPPSYKTYWENANFRKFSTVESTGHPAPEYGAMKKLMYEINNGIEKKAHKKKRGKMEPGREDKREMESISQKMEVPKNGAEMPKKERDLTPVVYVCCSL